MASKRGKRTQGHLIVKVTYVSLPSADRRLAQAVDLLLKLAATHATKSQDNANLDREESSPPGGVQDMPTNSRSKVLDTPDN